MLGGVVGEETFGWERSANQMFYASRRWKAARDIVIIRDAGCDLGIPGHDIHDRVIVHHINPLTPKMLEDDSPLLYLPENLICCSHNTHNAIHYGDETLLPQPMIERQPGDHLQWERMW